MTETKIPEVGTALDFDELDMIASAIMNRQERAPAEPIEVSIALVLANIGSRYAPVQCAEQEWTGLKADIPPGDGIPKCPNGHVLYEGYGLKLGWVLAVD